MSHKQKHRGQQANDANLFDAKWVPRLNEAVAELSWLYSRGFAERSALKLVGDKHKLTQRQRKAVFRASCTDASRAHRKSSQIEAQEAKNQPFLIDGYNLLITIESALSGGILLRCRDGCIRDIASIHGTYRKVEETLPAIHLIGESLRTLQPSSVCWLFDAPISNSGRLKQLMLSLAAEQGYAWDAELAPNPDKVLVERTGALPISSDSWVLDQVASWFNFHDHILKSRIPEANILNLSGFNF
jgi:hypothetical protein